GDSEEVVCELVSALETALAYDDAFTVLRSRAALRARSFLCRYLYAFNGAMAGQLAVTREAVATLAPDSREAEAMCETIGAIVARDLRGWHYVLTGGLLAHQSPYGFDAPMHGRYAYLRDSLERIADGIARLVPLARGVPCVYAPPGRDHHIVARAIATKLDVS